VKKKWSVLKAKINPGLLHGHSASKVMSSMIIFGGKKGGQICNDLWKFYFGNNSYHILCFVLKIKLTVVKEYVKQSKKFKLLFVYYYSVKTR